MKDDQQTNDDACSDCYIAGSVSAFRDEHQALLAELAQALKERDECQENSRCTYANAVELAKYFRKERTRADALEAARDHLRARLRELEPYAQHVNPCNAGSCRHCGWSESVHPLRPSTSAGAACETFSSEPCTCGLSDLLAILSEPEEAQQTEKEPDHARMDTKADAQR